MTRGLIPQRPDRTAVKDKVDDFIGGAVATKADQTAKSSAEPAIYQKPVKFMLEVPTADFRTQLKIEAIQKGYPNMSDYICAILGRREELNL